MLRAGGSLVEIGQVLRHDSAGATAVYARVDVERLRTIARAWPTSTNMTAYSDRLMAGHLLPRAVSSHYQQASYSLSVY
jgi:hypothetical protein